MDKNPLLGLKTFGQSVWLDYLRRNALDNGEIEGLINDDGVSIPVETLNAFREHGIPASRLEEGTQEAYRALEGLRQTGISLDAMTQELEDEGVTKFSQAFVQLMAALQEKRAAALERKEKA